MTKRIELRWPKKGVSDDQPRGKQAALTTPHAKNVRTQHRGTAQGAQRPGWSNFTTGPLVPGRAVDAVASVAIDLPKVQYFGPGDSQILKVWGHTVPGLRNALAIDVDTEGNLYVLDEAGTFEKIGPDGEVAATTSFSTPQLERVVPRIALDFDGNVYVATTNSDGYSSRVLKFERLDDETFTRVWEYTGIWGIRDFQVGQGIMAVARHYPIGEAQKPADVVVMGELYGDGPQEFHVAAVPNPVSAIDLTPSGEVLFASKADTGRNLPDDGEGWVDSIVQWSPHEIGDVTGTVASSQLHFWADAETLLESLVNGDDVKQILDRRWLFTTQDVTDLEDGMLAPSDDYTYVPPTDLIARPLMLDQWVNFWPPEFRSRGAGGMPTLRFGKVGQKVPWRSQDDYNVHSHTFSLAEGTFPIFHHKLTHMTGSQLIAGQLQTNRGKKEDLDELGDPNYGFPNKEGLMRYQGSVIPSHEKAVWATFFVFRYHKRNKAEVVFHHRSTEGVEYALIMNADHIDVHAARDYGNTDNTAGSLSLFIGNVSPDKTAGPVVGVAGGSGHGGDLLSCDLTAPEFSNDQQIAIVCIQHEGAPVTVGGPQANIRHGLFRVNGRTVDRFTSQTGLADASSTGSSFGTTTDDHGVDTFTHMNAWEGDLLEVVTILGNTSNDQNPNEDPVTWPGHPTAPAAGAAALQWQNVSALAYTGNEQAYTDLASQIERMEGHLAYKWKSGNILPGKLVAPTTGGTFQDAHPFAYTSSDGINFDEPRPPVGSPTAGGLVLGPTGLALLSPKEIVGKIGSAGRVEWALAGGGHGLGVRSGPDGAVLTVGRQDSTGGGTATAKRLKDLGSGVRTTGEDTWEHADSKQDVRNLPVPGLAVDDAGNLYWPRYPEQTFARFQVKALRPGPASGTNGSTLVVNYPVEPATGLFEDRYLIVYDFTAFPGSNTIRVAQGLTVLETANNFVAAIRDNGITSGANKQYDARTNGASKYFEAFVETEGANVFVRVQRIQTHGLARMALGDPVLPHTLRAWTALSPAAFYFDTINFDVVAMNLDSAKRRIEVLAAEDGKRVWSNEYPDYEIPLAVGLDPNLPLYPTDHDLEDFPEHVYVAQRNNVEADGSTSGLATGDNLVKLRQVERRQVIEQNRSPRATVHVATCAGNFYTVKKGQAPKLVNNGGGVFNPESPFAKLFTYRQKVYGLDGVNYIKFDPKVGLMEEWKADGAGEIPPGAKLAANFLGRIALSRTDDDPHNLHLSERGNPDGWDTSPKVISPLSAFSGDASGNLHFKLHDLVNCLIPARDDLLIIGGDKSISRLTGDPGGQGQLDNITTSEGLAFGDAYCIAPDGTVFAKGVNGGVWRLGANGSADRISLLSIERRLQDINQAEYDIRMVWNFRQEGMHVFVVPKGLGERLVTHYFWDAKEAGWWPDAFSVVGNQPTSAGIFDGDAADDRYVVIGCEDGYVRFEDEDAKDDAGNRIISECVFGGLVPDSHGGQLAFSHLEPTLASDMDGVDVELYLGEVSDVVAGGSPHFKRHARPGYNGSMLCRGKANQAWIQLRSAAAGEAWALEALYIRARAAGRRRMM